MKYSDDSKLQSGDARTTKPRLLWRTRMGQSYGGARPQTIGRRIFAWDNDSILCVFDALSGTLIERHPVPGRLFHKPPAVHGSLAYLCVSRSETSQSGICAYVWQQQRVLWFQESQEVVDDLVVSRSEIVTVSGDGIVAALD